MISGHHDLYFVGGCEWCSTDPQWAPHASQTINRCYKAYTDPLTYILMSKHALLMTLTTKKKKEKETTKKKKTKKSFFFFFFFFYQKWSNNRVDSAI